MRLHHGAVERGGVLPVAGGERLVRGGEGIGGRGGDVSNQSGDDHRELLQSVPDAESPAPSPGTGLHPIRSLGRTGTVLQSFHASADHDCGP